MGTIETAVEKHIATAEKQLKSWAAKLDEVLEDAERSGKQAKAESTERIEAVRTKLSAAEARLDELKRAEASKWDRFKADLQVALRDIEAAFEALTRPPSSTRG